MRFGISSGARVGDLHVNADARLAAAGEIIGAATSPELHVVNEVEAIVITSRRHLYEGDYELGQATALLGSVTHAAQGPPRGAAGSRRAAVYYVDDYSTLARGWDNEAWDPTSEDTANVATRDIDDLLEDWAEDSDGTEDIVILGDDDVVPFFRKAAPCEGEESEYAWGSPPSIALLMANDYMGTDHHYSDLVGEGWWFPRTRSADVGRIIGDSAATMQSLFEHGLAGPSPGPIPWAVTASWDGCDLDFTGDEGVVDHVEAWGYRNSGMLVDNDDWRSDLLLPAIAHSMSLFIFSGPSGANTLLTPPWFTGDVLDGSLLAATMDDADSAARRPFVGFLGGRTGYSFIDGSLFDHLAAEGASGMMGVYGEAFDSPEGSEWYTEDVVNKFWRRTMPSSGGVRSVGSALRLAKLAHDPTSWTCRHQTAVWGPTVFGVPWLTIPRGDADEPESVAAARTQPPVTTVRASAAGASELIATVDASAWSLDRTTAPGFDLVAIAGFTPDPDAGPTLPARMLELALPAGAEVTSVEVSPELELDLGTLAIPTWVSGDDLADGGDPAAWTATPASLGTVPSSCHAHAAVEHDGHTMLHVKLYPVRYDAATGRTTLYRRLALRVAFTASEPVAVVDAGLDRARVAPFEAAGAWADVANVSDGPVELTAEAVLRDGAGAEAGRAAGGPFAVAAGANARVTWPLPVTQVEGGYDVELEILRSGTPVGGAAAFLEVSAGHVAELTVPASVVAGRATAFSLTYANTGPTPVTVEVGLDILGDGGAPVETLAPQTIQVPAAGEATVSFAWDARSVTTGRYQVRATATPDGGVPRSVVRVLDVRPARSVHRRLGGQG